MPSRRFNICITLSATAAFALLSAFIFADSYLRVAEAFRDLGNSIAFYFAGIFGIEHDITPTVTGLSSVMQWEILLPDDWETFKAAAKEYFTLIADVDNIKIFFTRVGSGISAGAKAAAIILPCLILFVFAASRLYASGNTRHNTDTLPLRVYREVTAKVFRPIKMTFIEYKHYLAENKKIYIVWAVLWAVNFNLVTIAAEFFAYYFYFAVGFDVEGLYIQVCKLFIDLQVIFTCFPWWVLLIAAWPLFDRWRKKIAVSKLRHFEARNCGFINELPIVSITCGSMGKKKTTMITDMTLSQEVMFRQKALEILQQNDMKFPYFPWIAFEDELLLCMDYGTVYNLATVKAWVDKKMGRFMRHGNADLQLYGYDYRRYGIVFDDALAVQNLFDTLKTYAMAYFIYVLQSSLIVSNYSVRTDNEMLTEGNFPVWITEFFPERRRRISRHSHVLDFDVLRLGKKVLENNPKAGSFEFGVVAITEIGKERGNNLELKEVKKGSGDTNQKNDLFNSWLKMCRHSATVDNFPFIKVFTDEQRPESWGADARDLCDVVHIVSSGERRLTLPFYTIEEMLSEWAFNRFISLYYDFRFRRGDNTLLVHILKSITAWLWRRNLRIHNCYGYSVLKIEKERGTMNGKTESRKYYLMNAKIYAQRFSTDCFSDYFNDMAKRSKTGLMDYMEYVTEKASVEELKMQNSYFINSLYKDEDGDGSA